MHKNLKSIFGTSSKIQEITNKENNPFSPELLKDIISQISSLTDQLIVIKFPKEVILDEKILLNYVQNCSYLIKLGLNLVIVHDYVEPEEFFAKNDSNPFKNIRINSDRYFLEMFMCGYIARKIISYFNSYNIASVNIAAKDSDMISGKKISTHNVKESGIVKVNFSGKPDFMDPSILLLLQESGIVPIITPIAKNEKDGNFLLDTNYTSALISVIMDAAYLILPSENIPTNIEKEYFSNLGNISTIKNLQKSDPSINDLYESAIFAIQEGIENVALVNSKEEDGILKSIFSKNFFYN